MFRDRRRLRRWAAQVLLVWLFGIATGIAHACALRLGHQAVDHRYEATAVAADHEAKPSHGHDESGAGEPANCLDFCEKSSVTAPSLKLKLDQGSDLHAIAVLPSSPPWLVTVFAQASDHPDRVTNRRGGPPPRIAFQRLAL